MYKLLLVGCFTPWRNNTSCEFFSDEFAKRFSKLPVTLIKHHFDDPNFPEADVALVHAYISSLAVQQVAQIKKKVKKVVYFMEEPMPNAGFDHCYFYNLDLDCDNSTFIKAPVVKEQYDIFPKEPGSILLDHDAELFQHDKESDWTERLWDFFGSNPHYGPVYQLERGNVKHPDFIKKIPIQSHKDYLNATSRIETFICTWSQSYNHTVVDMAIRGSNVIVPMSDKLGFRKEFVPICLVEDFDMIRVLNEKQLDAALKSIGNGSIKSKSRLDVATDLDEVVSIMDKDFRSWMYGQTDLQFPKVI